LHVRAVNFRASIGSGASALRQRRRSTTIPAMIVSFNIAAIIRGTVVVKR
jgi:hypothetical protein